MYDRVLIVARGPAPVIADRVATLAGWYGAKPDLRLVAGGAVTLATIGTSVAGAVYGESPPGALDILRANDLRRYSGGGVALASGMDRARIVGGAGAPACLFAAGGSAGLGAVAADDRGADDRGAFDDPSARSPSGAAAGERGPSGATAGEPGPSGATAGEPGPSGATAGEPGPSGPAAGERGPSGGVADGIEAWSTHAAAAAFVARGVAAVDPAALGEQLALGFVGGGGSLVSGVRALPVATLVDLDATRAQEYVWWPAAERWRPAGELGGAVRETLRDRLTGMHEICVADDAPAADRALAGLGLAAERFPITPTPPDPAVARWTDGSIALPGWPGGADALVIDGRIPADALASLDRIEERLAGVGAETVDRTRERITAWRDVATETAGVRGPRLYQVLGFEEHLACGLRGHIPPKRTPLIAALATPAVQRVLPWDAPPPAESLGVAAGLSAETREWIADDVFGHGLATGLGERWCSRTRSRFLAGHTAATTLALRLAGAVALDVALAELPTSNATG